MKPIYAFAFVTLASALACLSGPYGTARADSDPPVKPSIVLVHGAWADGSSWQKVIEVLQGDGYSVTAVQNPLTSLDDDIATTKRLIESQKGPVVVVGHSYGGAVITGAAFGEPNVKALVYVNAFAPDAGESLNTLLGKFPPTPLGASLVPDSAGFLYISRSKFHEVFCADLPLATSDILAATQKPIAGSAFAATLTDAAWKTIPSWYVVGQEDEAINPDLERFMAHRMNAHITEIKASHLSFISHPQEVAKVIEEAANASTQ